MPSRFEGFGIALVEALSQAAGVREYYSWGRAADDVIAVAKTI